MNSSSAPATAARGAPIWVIAAILLVWALARVVTWEAPFTLEMPPVFAPAAPSFTAETRGENATAAATPVPEKPRADVREADLLPPPPPAWLGSVPPPPAPAAIPPASPTQRMSARAAVGHTMLLAAGFAHMKVPASLLAAMSRRPAPDAAPTVAAAPRAAPFVVPPAGASAPARARRWSLDGWVLLRDDTVTPNLSGRPSYGRSQAGAVARYDLAPASAHRPQVHLRVATALSGQRESEAALGTSLRPLPHVPVRVATEVRVGETFVSTRTRGAAYAVTEIAPVDLPLGTRGEVYVQGGYVTGTFATAFVDGQARVDRGVAQAGDVDFRLGAGAWGGAQREAARLDIGPTASVTFGLGEARGRLAADYRVRVAGDAQPSSGPALTLSAGF